MYNTLMRQPLSRLIYAAIIHHVDCVVAESNHKTKHIIVQQLLKKDITELKYLIAWGNRKWRH